MAKQIFRYGCEFCNTENTRTYEINAGYRCKSCGKMTKPILLQQQTSSEENIKQQLQQIKSEKPEVKVETVNYDFKTLPQQNFQQTVNTGNTTASYTPTNFNNTPQQKVFSEDSIIQYFKSFDGMMKKKDPDFDISKDEEKGLSVVWTDWANDFFAKIKPQTAKLIVACATTFVVYTPRLVTYIGKIAEQQEKKKSVGKKETETETVEEKPKQLTTQQLISETNSKVETFLKDESNEEFENRYLSKKG